MPLPRLVFPERKCRLKLLKWMVHSSLPDFWALRYWWERGCGKHKEGSIRFAISTQRHWRPHNLLLQAKGLSRRTEAGKKTSVKRFLNEDKQQGSQKLQKTGPVFTAPQQQFPAEEGLKSRWRLLWTCGRVNDSPFPRGLAMEPYSPIPSPGGSHTSHKP